MKAPGHSELRVHTEWDPLEEVIVGRVEGARIPTADVGLWALDFPDLGAPDLIPSGPLPPRILEETEEDLAGLVAALERLGIRVRRPDPLDPARPFSSPDWTSDGHACYCPRDVLLAIGDTVIEAPMVQRSRQHEVLAYRRLLGEYADAGARWLAAPRPRLLDGVYRPPGARFAIGEDEPLFDAANVLRIGRDILYQVSASGNVAGARWLQRALGSEYRVHPLDDLYDSTHIDSTITLVRPGLVVVNARRISRATLPALFHGWDVVWLDDIIDIGWSVYPVASAWIGMNFLMLDPGLAVVDARQLPLIHELERRRVDVLPLPLRHARVLCGGFHCVTLDVRRRGELESYCT